MNDLQREALSQRYWRAEDKIRAIHAGKVVDGDPAAVEAKLLDAQVLEHGCPASLFSRRCIELLLYRRLHIDKQQSHVV